MNIKIWNDKYVIKSDPLNYKLCEIRTKLDKDDNDIKESITNDDGTYEVVQGYFRDVAGCYREIVELEGRKNKCTTLEGYIKHISKINEQLEADLKKFETLVGGKERLAAAITKTISQE